MVGIGLFDAAGRNAYLAAFHAAQALIFERTGRVHKTHRGVQTEFLRLTKDDESLDRDPRSFLARAYNLKAVADYETGPNTSVPPERAKEALGLAQQFMLRIGFAASRN